MFYNSLNEFLAFILEKQKGQVHLGYHEMPAYAGMALVLLLNFDVPKSSYCLDLQWECVGLDFYGDTLQESYVYEFESLEKLLVYVQEKYNMHITEFPIKYSFDRTKFPDPIINKAEAPIFNSAWERFQLDFKNDKFLDPSQKLVYTSQNKPD